MILYEFHWNTATSISSGIQISCIGSQPDLSYFVRAGIKLVDINGLEVGTIQMWRNNNQNRLGYSFGNVTVDVLSVTSIYITQAYIRLTKTKAECTFEYYDGSTYRSLYFEESLPSGFAYNKEIKIKVYSTIQKTLSGLFARVIVPSTTTSGGTHKLISNGIV
jgi:hypothetical protein